MTGIIPLCAVTRGRGDRFLNRAMTARRLFNWMVGVLILLSAGCSSDRSSNDPVEWVIQFWDYQRGELLNAWQEETIAQFEQQHERVRVEITRLPWQGGAQKLDIAVFSGKPPDVGGSALNIAFVEQGMVEPWDDFLTEEDYADIYPSALEACRWEGHIWAMPWYKTAYVMLLNLDLFRAANVTPPRNHQWTWEEFLDKMKSLTVDLDDDGIPDQYGVGFNIFPEEFESWAFLYNEGTEILSEDRRECLFNSAATIRGVQKLYDLAHTVRVAPMRSGGMRHFETWNAFTNDWRTAVTCQGLWAIHAQRRNNRESERFNDSLRQSGRTEGFRRVMDFDVALFPTPGTGEPILASAGVGNFVIFKQTDSHKRDLCVELVRHLTSGEAQHALTRQSLFPTRRSAGNLYGEDPILSFLYPYVAEAKVHPLHPEWVNIDKTLSKELQLAVLGNKPIVQAVEDGDRRVQILLDRYYERRDSRR